MFQEITIIGYAAKSPKKISIEKYPNLIYFSVGVNGQIKNKDTGGFEDKTTWYSVIYNSEFGSGYYFDNIKKGDKIFIKGKPNFEFWTDTHGEKQLNIKISANKIELMKKSDISESENQSINSKPTARFTEADFSDLDDSIPF